MNARKAKVVMYDNTVQTVEVFHDAHGDHARICKKDCDCPVLLPDGHSDSWIIKRWCRVERIK